MIVRVGRGMCPRQPGDTGTPVVPWVPSDQAGLSLWVAPSSIVQSSGDVTEWTDLSANGNDLLPIGTPTTDGTKVSFSGFEHLEVADAPSLDIGTGDMLLGVRVKIAGGQMIAGKDSYDGGDYYGYYLQHDGTNLIAGVREYTTAAGYASYAWSPTAGFHTIILARLSNVVNLYLDGALVATWAEDPGPANADNSVGFKIGAGDESSPELIGEVKGAVLYKTTPTGGLIAQVNDYLSAL